MQSAAQKPNSPKQRHGRSRTPPPISHGQRQVGQAEEQRACYGLNSPLPSPCTWGQEAAKIDGFNLEVALGIRKRGGQWGKQALPPRALRLAGVRAQRCQLGCCCGRGRRGGAWCHWVHAKGDSCRPPPARGWLKPFSLHLILMPGTTPGPHISILWRKPGLCFKLPLPCQPRAAGLALSRSSARPSWLGLTQGPDAKPGLAT